MLSFGKARIKKGGANKSEDNPNKNGPHGYFVSAAVNSHRIRINRVYYRTIIDDAADYINYPYYKKDDADFLHNIFISSAGAVCGVKV